MMSEPVFMSPSALEIMTDLTGGCVSDTITNPHASAPQIYIILAGGAFRPLRYPYCMIPAVATSDKSITDQFKSVPARSLSFWRPTTSEKLKAGCRPFVLLLLLASNFSTTTSRSLADKHHEGQRQVA